MRPTLQCLRALTHGPSSPRSKSIAFIGLGRMGSEMAFNLFSKKFAAASETHFVVCDALPEAAQSFRDNFLKQFPAANIEVEALPERAVVASGTVITMLPSSPHVQSVYGGAGGIYQGLQTLSRPEALNTLCIDSTTLDVKVAQTAAQEAVTHGAEMVDAPVSGGVTGAKAGTLTFLVGGTDAGFQRAAPFLSCMGHNIKHCGPSGSGLAAKICNNLVLGVQQIVVAEAMLLGARLGLDPAVLAGVINTSTGACWSSSVNNPVPAALPDKSPPCERDYEGGFATALMLKDMGLARGLGTTLGSPLPLGEAAERIYADVLAVQPELARKDFSAVYKYLEDAAQEGRKVRLGEIVST